MIPEFHPNFRQAIHEVGKCLQLGHHKIHPDQWQSIDVSKNPQADMAEILDISFQVGLQDRLELDLNELVLDIEPNIPWADDHFLERVGREPLNPGVQWRFWPWATSADKFRKEDEKFSHSYMERFWPKTTTGNTCVEGIRYDWGDLDDVVAHLRKHPLSRQAYLPIFFPEDTGVVHGQRIPCTLGYHFILRHGKFHCTYYIRSCDFYRHFRDDVYLAVRLQEWVLTELRKRDPTWDLVRLGNFTFHCVSMHCFRADFQKLFKQDI